MDTVSKEKRSYIMSRIRGKNTRPEIALRKHLRGIGLTAFRARAKLPGTPDIYFPAAKVAVFVEGCFWHGCRRCFRAPKSNRKYWTKKIADNRARDKRTRAALRRRGIAYITIWEHQIRRSLGRCGGRTAAKIDVHTPDLPLRGEIG
jgi:DNA mismatch endonuclease (patch repair protein)